MSEESHPGGRRRVRRPERERESRATHSGHSDLDNPLGLFYLGHLKITPNEDQRFVWTMQRLRPYVRVDA